MTDEPREIVLLSRAEQALVEASTVDEARDVRDKAAAIIIYAKKAKLGQSMAAEACAVRLRAERRMGELLQATPLAKAAPGNQHTGPVQLSELIPAGRTLRELGITKSDSSRSQRIAAVPSPVFEEYISASLAVDREPTAAGLFRLASTEPPSQKPENKHSVTPDLVEDAVGEVSLFTTGFLDLHASGLESPGSGAAVDDACQIPVGRRFHDQAHLHVLVTPAGLLTGLDILDAWQFTYRDVSLVGTDGKAEGSPWQTPNGLLLLGVRGALPLRTTRHDIQEFDEADRLAPLTALIEQLSPGPYTEILASENRARQGWDSIWPIRKP